MIGMPSCMFKRRIHDLAALTDNADLMQLSESLQDCGPRHIRTVGLRLEEGSIEQLLKNCERRIAGGLALHTLATAMNDGMAPLDLPLDSDLPATKRAAMLEALPSGALVWSGSTFEDKVRGCLDSDNPPQLWLAAANFMAREGRQIG